ncbi:MAG: hypothetical protein ABH830_03755 [Patescibacteria group bacterium]
MVSPNLTRKIDNSLTINTNTKKLFQVIYREQTKDEENDDVPKIRVSELISKMAFYYEKIRNSVDYKEEYLLRKNAIDRILKRLIVIEGVVKESKSEEIAKNLLIELIRAGYLPNNKIPEEKINEVKILIEKYLKLKNYSLARLKASPEIKSKNQQNERTSLTNWLISTAASEIEEIIGLDKANKTVISNMYEDLISIVKLPTDLKFEKDLEIQIYLGIYRNFLKFDQDMLGFILFKYYSANWENPKDEDIAKIAQNIISLRQAIGYQLNHPISKQLDKIINRYTVFYTILIDVISEDPTGAYESLKNDAKAFPRLIKKVCARRYKSIKSKLWRAAIRSIIYIFITKSVFVVLLEVPAIQWFGGELNYTSLAINITFPAFLLFLIVIFTQVPSDDNTKKVIDGIEEIVYLEKKKAEQYILRKPVKRSKLANAIFGIFYTITFFLSFGFVIWALDFIAFNFVSITIFLFFLALVSFFGLRIRKGTKEFIIIEPKENIFSFILDFFYVPIIATGKWLMEKFSRINVFVFFLDFIIEAPFKIFVEVAEQWTKYVRERKDEIS